MQSLPDNEYRKAFINERFDSDGSDWGKDFGRDAFGVVVIFNWEKKKHLVESISIVNLFLVCTYSHVHNILRLSDSSTNFPSTTSGTNRNY